jgi:hypothetical protein
LRIITGPTWIASASYLPSSFCTPWREPQKIHNGRKATVRRFFSKIFEVAKLLSITKCELPKKYSTVIRDPDAEKKFPVPSRLRNARKQVKEGINRAASDCIAFDHDVFLYPKNSTNQRGETRWCGSTAETLLRQDIQVGKHDTMKPMELHKTREEYEKFPLDVFRGHIYQEVKRNKSKKQYYQSQDSL